MGFLKRATTSALRLLYPKRCCHCQIVGEYLCPICHELLYFYNGKLDLKLEDNALDSVTVATSFEPPISNVIHALKYQSVKDIAGWCAELLYMSTNIPTAEVLVPVPISSQRYRERGFNQAEEIAFSLATYTQLPVTKCIKRTKHLSAQASVQRHDVRMIRLQNCFKVVETSTSPSSVILLDDVITTGATLNECAKTLKNAGVKTVHALAIAHGS